MNNRYLAALGAALLLALPLSAQAEGDGGRSRMDAAGRDGGGNGRGAPRRAHSDARAGGRRRAADAAAALRFGLSGRGRGRQIRSANAEGRARVSAAHKLEKIDGQGRPADPRGRFFGDDVSPCLRRRPAPRPARRLRRFRRQRPVPRLPPTATPDMEHAPFAMREMDFSINGQNIRLAVGQTETGETLYPLVGVMERLDYDCAYDGNGGWQLVQQETGAQMAVMTDGSDGLCENALAIVDGVILLSDDSQRVYAYAGEAYLNDVMMDKLGVSVMLLGETALVETR